MLVMLCLSVLTGFGADQIIRSLRHGAVIVAIGCLLFLVEAAAIPIGVNGTAPEETLNDPPGRVFTGDSVPPVFLALRGLPDNAVIAHFPFGSDQYELRYVYYSTVHWRQLLNGYSGAFPLSYLKRRGALQDIAARPDLAWAELSASGATHAVVHGAAYRGNQAGATEAWLRRHGATAIQRFGSDTVFALPRP
jgi:hypothetical protein